MIATEQSPAIRWLRNVHLGPLAATLLLSLIGLLTIHSASAEMQIDYMPKQAVRVMLGAILLLIVLFFDYHRLVDLAPAFYGLGLGLLVIVLFSGHEAGGARSWLQIGPLNIQPSELVKIATALMLARYLSEIRRSYLLLKEILIAVALVAVPMLLIVAERDLGSAAMYAPLLAGMLLVAGIRWQQLVAAVLLGLVLAAGAWSFALKPYQKQRVVSFLSPDEDPLGAGYQVRQSKIAVGSGQWVGRGYGQGTQSQLRFLPARHTDFIMAVLAEEWGFVGVATVIGLYGFYIFSAANIAMRSRDRAGILLVVGLVSIFAFHVVYNTAMVVGLLPITGIPLPFLSYGGSFTLMNFIATGLILNVDHRRYVNR